MIRTRHAVCMKCNQEFPVHVEIGHKAHLLHCVRCGREKRLGYLELREYYQRYEESLLNPVSEDIRKRDVSVKPLITHELLDMRKYILMVENIAGSCICGAVFRFSGKPRCPKCKSTVFQIRSNRPAPLISADQADPGAFA